jgi:hypothetical protein
LYAPDGTEWPDFASSVTAQDGTVTHEFVLPLKAPAGKWKVVASEAISGLGNAVEIAVPLSPQN